MVQTNLQSQQSPHGVSIAILQQQYIIPNPSNQQQPQQRPPQQHTHIPTQTQNNSLTKYLYHPSNTYTAPSHLNLNPHQNVQNQT